MTNLLLDPLSVGISLQSPQSYTNSYTVKIYLHIPYHLAVVSMGNKSYFRYIVLKTLFKNFFLEIKPFKSTLSA